MAVIGLVVAVVAMGVAVHATSEASNAKGDARSARQQVARLRDQIERQDRTLRSHASFISAMRVLCDEARHAKNLGSVNYAQQVGTAIVKGIAESCDTGGVPR